MTTAALLPVLWLALASSPEAAIDPDELKTWAAGSACQAADVALESVVQHDFDGDGIPEAVVVASTCSTGTAGPDVHAVVTRDAAGGLVELPLPRLDPGTYDVLFGNRNYRLSVDGELLVQTFSDTSGRPAPLVVRYRFTGSAFEVESVTRSPTFPTSFDCSTTAVELERGICHVEGLASLDLALARAYNAARMKAAPSQRAALKDAQRRWQADRDERCWTKLWVSCVEEAYRKRLAELGGAAP